MAGFFLNYCLSISCAGVCLLIFFSICCFSNMEALHLPKGTRVQRGFEVLCAAVIYAGIVAFVLYRMQRKEEKSKRQLYGTSTPPNYELQQKLI